MWALTVVFLAAAGAIWVAGISLARQTDILAVRWNLGSAIGGVILLAVATNLPEIAIVASASEAGRVEVAIGNILGGIAIQTVVLVAVDCFGVRGERPLSYQAASLVLVLEAILVVVVLALVIIGTQLPDSLIALRVTPVGVLITAAWVAGLLVVWRASRSLPWRLADDGPAERPAPTVQNSASTGKAVLLFSIAAVATLIAGVCLERTGDVLADHLGLSGALFGATILAVATSLPELSTGIASAREGDSQLAVSDIFGGNAFLPVLFLMATLLSGQAVLPDAQPTDLYLTALGIVLTLVYAVGLILRPRRRIVGMGPDSLAVLALYALGVLGLFVISG